MSTERPDLAAFRARARAWLAAHAEPRPAATAQWGEGSDDVSIFHDLDHEAEADLVRRNASWQRAKVEGGYGALTWPAELGGAGLPPEYERAFHEEEQQFDVPPRRRS